MPVGDVWLTPVPFKESRLWRVSSTAVIGLVSLFGKTVIGRCNKPNLHNESAFLKCVQHRPPGKPLLTVANHYSCVDDFIISYVLPWKTVLHRCGMRWMPGAKDICNTNFASSVFFQLGRVVPVVRGEGVYQQGMDFCAERLSVGEWVHIFPEGRINMEHKYLRLKWGVGRLVADSTVSPLVLPYWHVGMDDIWPNKAPYYPRTGKKMTVLFGEPLDFESELSRLRQEKWSGEEIRKYITDRIQEELLNLRHRTERLHLELTNN